MNKELRDVIAAVLDENRLRSPRVQANAVLAVLDGKPRRAKPAPVAACPSCAEWRAAAAEPSIRAQVIEVAAVKGRLKELAWWLFSQGDRVGRRTG